MSANNSQPTPPREKQRVTYVQPDDGEYVDGVRAEPPAPPKPEPPAEPEE